MPPHHSPLLCGIIVPVHGPRKDHRLHHRGPVIFEATQIKNTTLSPFTLRKH